MLKISWIEKLKRLTEKKHSMLKDQLKIILFKGILTTQMKITTLNGHLILPIIQLSKNMKNSSKPYISWKIKKLNILHKQNQILDMWASEYNMRNLQKCVNLYRKHYTPWSKQNKNKIRAHRLKHYKNYMIKSVTQKSINSNCKKMRIQQSIKKSIA